MLKLNIKAVLLLTGLSTFLWSFVSGLLMGLLGFTTESSTDPSSIYQAVVAVVGMSFFNSILVIWYAHRSKLSDMRLFSTVFLFIFGVMSFMTQIETLYFNDSINMPLLIIAIVVFTGAVVGIANAWFALKFKRKLGSEYQYYFNQALHPSLSKLLLLSTVYMLFYFFFGYYIAWQFPELRQFYTGSFDRLPFITHMKNQILTDPYLIAFQLLRGALWTLIGYITLKGLKSQNSFETYILVGLILSLPLSTPLFSPNEYMPPGVRFGHFFELLIENFLFGLILCYVYLQRPKPKFM